jgi:hypothetical protein
MRRNNYPLRLQPSLMEEARQVAESEGVALNQLFNVAVAEKLATLRTEKRLWERIRRAGRSEPEQILDRAGIRNPSTESDDISVDRLPVLIATVTGGLRASLEAFSVKVQPAPPPELERAGEIGKPFGRATPQFGKLKKRLEKTRGR